MSVPCRDSVAAKCRRQQLHVPEHCGHGLLVLSYLEVLLHVAPCTMGEALLWPGPQTTMPPLRIIKTHTPCQALAACDVRTSIVTIATLVSNTRRYLEMLVLCTQSPAHHPFQAGPRLAYICMHLRDLLAQCRVRQPARSNRSLEGSGRHRGTKYEQDNSTIDQHSILFPSSRPPNVGNPA